MSVQVQFDPVEHRYTVDGMRYPSVTEVLDPIAMLDGIPAELLAAAADLGKKAHLACHLDDAGQLNEIECDPALLPYVRAWRKYQSDTGFVVLASELIVLHHTLKYAGMLDKYGRYHSNPLRALLDLKTALLVPRTVGPQVAAYQEALISMQYPGVNHRTPRKCVTLFPDATYKETALTRKDDFNLYISALNIYRWRTSKPRFTD